MIDLGPRHDRRRFLQVSAAAGLAVGFGPWQRRLARAAEAGGGGAAELRFRQVHLDFHTPAQVERVAAAFDPEAFVATLKRARVNSVTCFARCHHGYIYYDTKAHPERHHPHLKRNLLVEQIEVCHKNDIRVPIYVTVQWDRFTADQHPEWRQVTAAGALQGTPPYEAGFYQRLCVNSPYVEQFLKPHLADVFASVPAVDGFFLDIVHEQDCSCVHCLGEMKRRGLDASNADARLGFGRLSRDRFTQDLSAFLRKKSRTAAIFYNGGHVGPRMRPTVPAQSHLELESLPSGGWGYLHFPLTMRYARTLGLDALGMTGKFHTSWGDFHSLKNQAALQFECFQMLALGAKCSIGDQLHPTGKIDAATYDLIGSVYREVERKEPWCGKVQPLVDIGVLNPEEFGDVNDRVPASARGVVRMLQESAHQFDVIDSSSDFSRYRVLVLPDDIAVSGKLESKITEFVRRGGAVIASYKSCGGAFGQNVLGVKVKGDAPFSPDFVRARAKLGKGLPASELVMYMKGLELQPLAGTDTLADVLVPYFNRTWEHYFSHKHTPSAGKVGYPGVLQRGRTISFAHPIFRQYAKNAPHWCKALLANALDLLLPQPLVRLAAPSTTLSALNAQPERRRWVMHLLHYVPERRGDDFDVIEDVIPIHDVGVSVRMATAPAAVKLVPDGRPLAFTYRGGRAEFVVPVVAGHQMIELAL